MISECKNFIEMLPDFKEQNLPEEQLDFAAEHINHCEHCLEKFENTSRLANHSLFEEAHCKAPASLKNNILDSFQTPPPKRKRLWFPRLLPMFSTSFALASLCFAVFYSTGSNGPKESIRASVSTTTHQKPILKVNQASHTLDNRSQDSALRSLPKNNPSLQLAHRNTRTQSQPFYRAPNFNHSSVQFEGWQESIRGSKRRLNFQYRVSDPSGNSKIRVQNIAHKEIDQNAFNQRQVKGKTMWVRNSDSSHLVYIKHGNGQGLLLSSTLPIQQLLNIAATLD